MQKNVLCLILSMCLVLPGAVQAGLINRGGGMIYDNVLDVTWLQDANYAMTSGYDADGRMNWMQAQVWAANLVYGGYDDWRLPTMVDTGASGCDAANSGTDCGSNVQTVSGSTVYSEMAHMYFNNLGLKSYYSPSGTIQADSGIFGNGVMGGQNNVGLVQNLQSYSYWTNVEYAPDTNFAWDFDMDEGGQDPPSKGNGLYVWAVRSGDVAGVPLGNVPTPTTLLLMGLGLAGLGVVRRLR